MKNISRAYKVSSVIIGTGCFWLAESTFATMNGVVHTQLGFAGGEKESPTYEMVTAGQTDYAEVLKIDFDARIISIDEILNTSLQLMKAKKNVGLDVYRQYRNIICYSSEEEQGYFQSYIEKVVNNQPEITIELYSGSKFYLLNEKYIQFYKSQENNPYHKCVVELQEITF